MDSMRKSRLSKAKQDRLIELFVAGTTARCAAALVGANRKTAIYYFHRLRELIVCELDREAYAAGRPMDMMDKPGGLPTDSTAAKGYDKQDLGSMSRLREARFGGRRKVSNRNTP